MVIVVLALNPSIDVEWRVDRVQWEEKNIIQSERRWAGGKGVNVARWLRHLGCDTHLLVPLGGPTGEELIRHLRAEKQVAQIVPLREATRANVIVTTVEGRQLRFNPRGPKLSPSEWSEVFRRTEQAFRQASCLVLSGSLPRQAPSSIYARLIRLARTAGCKVLLDCDGPAFASAVPARPFLVKPNEHELAAWHGKALRSAAQVRRAARALSVATGGWVLISRGGKGAILINAKDGCILEARAPRVETVNTVGAGDALVAGLARQISRGASPAEWLQWGVATGTAATQCQAGSLAKGAAIGQLAGQISIAGSEARGR